MNACSRIIRDYLDTLNDRFTVVSHDRFCAIVTPFTKPDGEQIEVLLEEIDQGVKLTDGSATADYLFVNGLNLNRRNREQIAAIAHKYDMLFENEELFTIAGPGTNPAIALHGLLEAIQAATFLIYRVANRDPQTIFDEIQDLLEQHEVKYQRQFQVKGVESYTIPFYVNGQRRVLIDAVAATSVYSARNKTRSLALQWLDIYDHNPERYTCVSVLDDTGDLSREDWDATALRLLEQYYQEKIKGKIVYWANKEELLPLVAG